MVFVLDDSWKINKNISVLVTCQRIVHTKEEGLYTCFLRHDFRYVRLARNTTSISYLNGVYFRWQLKNKQKHSYFSYCQTVVQTKEEKLWKRFFRHYFRYVRFAWKSSPWDMMVYNRKWIFFPKIFVCHPYGIVFCLFFSFL